MSLFIQASSMGMGDDAVYGFDSLTPGHDCRACCRGLILRAEPSHYTSSPAASVSALTRHAAGRAGGNFAISRYALCPGRPRAAEAFATSELFSSIR